MDRYNQIHLWIGSNFEKEENYQQYFELDYSTEGDFEALNYKVCGFCKDIGSLWYDQDFIGIIPRFEKELPLEDILPFSSIDRSEWGKIKLLCNDLGIYQANVLFWYADAELTIPTPYKDSYNGLKYIGVFQGD